ncbi:MAG: DNA polymerase I, partial [Clostridia bacterium]|nr:DNA polymerase I [Clostridia bacterium]
LLVAFDRKEPTFRHLMYSDYKGTRKPMPDDLVPQIPLLKRVLDALGIARFDKAGIEADDIIGTLAKKYDCETIIYTGDKDSFQLVDGTTSVYFTRHGISETEQYTAFNFVEKVGITPKQIIDLKALMGDSSDNIPGVKGVGEKTGLNLVQKYGSVENLYDNIDEVAGKLKDKLIEFKDDCFLSKTLATIKTDVDVDMDFSDFEFSYPFGESAKKIFKELEFRNLLKKTDIFAADQAMPVEKNIELKTEYLTSADSVMSHIKTSKIAVYIEDNISFYDGGDTEWSLKIQEGFFDEGLSFDDAVKAVAAIFSDPKNTVIVYGKKNLLHLFKNYGVTVKAKVEDLLLLKYLTDFTGKEEDFVDVLTAAGYDKARPAFAVYDMFADLYARADDKEKALYSDVELPLADVLFDMEEEGFKVDKQNLENMSAYYGEKCSKLLKSIQDIAGEAVNPNSSKQLSVVLFEKLGLKHGKKIKTGGYSTDSDILEKLSDEHEIIPLILEYRKYAKLLSTYIDGFRPLIDKNGLIHTTYYQAQTSTGRLSSRKPNLQNIPIRDDEGREVRKLFSAKSGERTLVD